MLTGMVSDAILSALYAQAQCVVYVPVVEGWGLPAVEAMRAGAPVVASPMPSTGGAALEVDPLDVDAIGEGILAAAGPRRASLIAAGTTRAASLTWSLAARAHVAVWEAARAS
jgi:glycosyltransferase involved in cell wall biosynthesis